MSFLDNTRKPEGFGGKLMIGMMNLGHRALARWGLSFVSPSLSAQVLDCGCGGGANVKTLLQRCPKGRVFGVDYSPVCVESARRKNKTAIEEGRCEVAFARVEALPFEGQSFELVTAFETVYFWPEIEGCFREVFRAAAGGAGRDGRFDHAGLSDASEGENHVSGLLARHDGAGEGKSAAALTFKRRVPAGGCRKSSFCRRKL